jgi:sulfite dehydrogenase (quinone) subunit SoeA
LITDELPGADKADEAAGRLSNSDPITGQAAWYDVRVRIYPAEADAQHTLPQFDAMRALPGSNGVISRIVQTYFAGRGEFAARLRGAVGRK